jgi:hypothetical protein
VRIEERDLIRVTDLADITLGGMPVVFRYCLDRLEDEFKREAATPFIRTFLDDMLQAAVDNAQARLGQGGRH